MVNLNLGGVAVWNGELIVLIIIIGGVLVQQRTDVTRLVLPVVDKVEGVLRFRHNCFRHVTGIGVGAYRIRLKFVFVHTRLIDWSAAEKSTNAENGVSHQTRNYRKASVNARTLTSASLTGVSKTALHQKARDRTHE